MINLGYKKYAFLKPLVDFLRWNKKVWIIQSKNNLIYSHGHKRWNSDSSKMKFDWFDCVNV